MSIYRGAGGAGDAVNDSSSEASLVAQLVIEAQADADAAQASATAAASSASGASSSASAASTSASNAATSATNASNSASSASTSATNASNSATAAQTAETAAELAETNAETAETNAETAATNAASSASAASTSATNASNSASAASTSATNASNSATAASTSASNASTSATSASNSASSATTSASNAATSETNAAASASSASTSATTATTQAGIATTQASNASTSATNASTSASAASTSATNASNSASAAAGSATTASSAADAALAALDSFDDRYLGQKSTAPTVDNDGNALVAGALYFNTTTNEMKVWDGSQWLNAYASLSGALLATNNLSDLNNTATARTNLGVAIGTNVQAYDADLTTLGAGGSSARSFLGLAIGTDVQAYDAQLADIAGLTPTDNSFIVGNGTNFVAESASTARTSLGLGTAATTASTDYATAAQGTKADNALTAANPSYTGTLTGGTGVVNLGSGQFYKDASGNVGIGTTSPAMKLDVSGGGIKIGYQGAPTWTTDSFLWSESGVGLNIDSYQLKFNTGASRNERMRIDLSGNVGIGTSSPAVKTEISGSAAASNLALRITNTATDGYSTLQMGDGNAGVYRNGSAQSGYAGASSLNLITVGAHPIGFSTQNTLRAVIDSSGNFQFNSGYGSVATAYGCRAWVNFNGTGTPAIRGSGNVSSITDNGTGDYTVNFTTAMPDANYAANVTGTHDSGSYVVEGFIDNDNAPTSSALRINFLNNSNTMTDASFCQVSVFR